MKRMIWLCLLLLALFAPARAEDTLGVCVDGTRTEMDREAYLVGAVAAEMPASYALEALKAQAVAARTRAVAGTCASHPGADICTDSGCCQGYLDEAAQEARWGGETAYWRARIVQAVEETRGVIMTWEGRPIEVLYHAVSGGQTEDVELVYSQALPYLRSVPSPGEETASGYESVQTFSHGELVALFPEQAVEGRVALEVLERSDSGRVLWLSVGGRAMEGRTLRSVLGLKSTNFQIVDNGDTVTFLQRGYGHGVGMSQAGANAMAQAGARWDEILLHYYTGVALTALGE